MPKFVHLRLSSTFSMLKSTIRFNHLAQLCNQYDMPAVAITDDNNMFGVVEFSEIISQKQIKPIIGTQINIKISPSDTNPKPLVFLAQNETGYQNLIKLSTKSHFNGKGQAPYLFLSSLDTINTSQIICLSGGNTGILAHMLQQHLPQSSIEHVVQKLKNIFQNKFYLEIHRHSTGSLQFLEDIFLALAQKYDLPPVATNDCMFLHNNSYEAHDILLCIKYNKKIGDINRTKYSTHHYFKSQEEMSAIFSDLPEALQNSVEIAKRCSYIIETKSPTLPPFVANDTATEKDILIKQAQQGLARKLQTQILKHTQPQNHALITKQYQTRLDKELQIITNMHYEGYFLIVADMVQWAKNNNIYVGPGRGSGAGSLVAWVLSITEINPIEFSLIFERFLNPRRVSLPDFDIDFCQENRERVIQYVCQKYSKDRVGQIITFGTLQSRAVIRDTGRVLGLPFTVTDRICKLVPNNPNKPVTLAECLAQDQQLKVETKLDPTIDKMINIAIQLEGLPRHASIHAAGIVIGGESLQNLLPLSYDVQSNLPVTQFNMKDVAKIGLVKFDLLGLKTLTLLKNVQNLIKESSQQAVMNLQDKKTFDLFCSGETTGIFQFESMGMRNLLIEAQPNNIRDLMALVALYRPGPMENIGTYIKARQGKIKPVSIHPLIDHIVQETYNVIIYQEQVMQISITLAGYSTEKADLLRRAMGKKIKTEMDNQKKDFITGAVNKGINRVVAEDIFSLIARFASYGFNKSHAACYALLAYCTAWYKSNFPLEFLCTAMNMEMHDPEKLLHFRQELNRLNICLLPPDINLSLQNFKIEHAVQNKPKIRFGLAAIKNFGEEISRIIVQERIKNGYFSSLQDLLKRLPRKVLNKKQLESLIASGALSTFYHHQKLINGTNVLLEMYNQDNRQVMLFSNQNDNLEKELARLPQATYLNMSKKESQTLHFNLKYNILAPLSQIIKDINGYDYQRFIASGNKSAFIICSILHVTHRRNNQGKRFAILIVQDLNNIFTIQIPENVINCHLDQLKVGNLIAIKCQKRNKNNLGKLTLLGQDITNIIDYLNKHLTVIKIYLHQLPKSSWLKAVIPTGNGTTRVVLQFPCPEDPGYYVSMQLTLKIDLTIEEFYLLIQDPLIKKIEFVSKLSKIKNPFALSSVPCI